MSRPRFTLRALLIAVAVCALGALVYSWIPHAVTSSELRSVTVGMTKDEVRKLLGEPISVLRLEQPHAPDFLDEAWYYSRGFLYLDSPPAVGFRDGFVAYVAP